MKITPQDLQALTTAVQAVLMNRPLAIVAYAEQGLTHKRYRWDVAFSIRHFAPEYDITKLYSYLDDDNIDTALRSILGSTFTPSQAAA